MELDALYAEVILDHNRRPRNWGELPPPARKIEGFNPLCGDRLTLWLDVDGDVVRDVKFTGEGCAISKASASMMTQAVKGKTRAEAEELFERFHALVTGTSATADPSLGSLRAFAGVARFPARVKCASLAWHAMHGALHGEAATTTEAP
jgi:nitrogen fixation NifU-like protein